MERKSGILLHPTSLPGGFGIGDLGTAAYDFILFLKASGQRLWQVLPLNYPGYGNSPYNALSAFAGNPYLISPDKMVEDGLLSRNELKNKPKFDPDRVLYSQVIEWKDQLFRKAFAGFNESEHADFHQFCTDHDFWLEDFAMFISQKYQFQGKPWNQWKQSFSRMESDRYTTFFKQTKQEVLYHKFLQWLFHKQWHDLYEYARRNEVEIIGDMPIYVSFDSADVWCHQHLFQVSPEGNPIRVAGVPPDYFSKTGQLWGNPLFNWVKMKESGYRWWINRVRHLAGMTDFQRIDHFIGFVRYWSIQYGEETAVNGHYENGPAYDFFDSLLESCRDASIVAEDLGLLTDEVIALRNHYGFPGMKVLHFRFSHEYHPTDFEENCICYTGTHDNDTTLGWYQHLKKNEPHLSELVDRYLPSDEDHVTWDLIKMAFESPAKYVVIPLQDILNLDSDARMNIPGTATGNWDWRFRKDMIREESIVRLRELTQRTIL